MGGGEIGRAAQQVRGAAVVLRAAQHGQGFVVEHGRCGVRLRERRIQLGGIAVAADLKQGHALEEPRRSRFGRVGRDAVERLVGRGELARFAQELAEREAGLVELGREAQRIARETELRGRAVRGEAASVGLHRLEGRVRAPDEVRLARHGRRRRAGQGHVPRQAVREVPQPRQRPRRHDGAAQARVLRIEQPQGQRDLVALDRIRPGDEAVGAERLRDPQRGGAREGDLRQLERGLGAQALAAVRHGHAGDRQPARQQLGRRRTHPVLLGRGFRGIERHHERRGRRRRREPQQQGRDRHGAGRGSFMREGRCARAGGPRRGPRTACEDGTRAVDRAGRRDGCRG